MHGQELKHVSNSFCDPYNAGNIFFLFKNVSFNKGLFINDVINFGGYPDGERSKLHGTKVHGARARAFGVFCSQMS